MKIILAKGAVEDWGRDVLIGVGGGLFLVGIYMVLRWLEVVA